MKSVLAESAIADVIVAPKIDKEITPTSGASFDIFRKQYFRLDSGLILISGINLFKNQM